MKRIYMLFSAVLGLVLALTACGSSGSSGGTAASAGAGSGSGSGSGGSSCAGPSSAAAGGASSGAAEGTGSASNAATYPAGTGSITIGSAAFPENVLLADIYAGALSAKGVKVSKKLQIGERPVYIKALQDGSIDMVPEYTGSILSYFDKSVSATAPDAVYAALQQKLPATLAVLNFAQAQDNDTIVVTQDTAKKYNLRTLADLCPVAGQLTLGAPKQFETRPDGVPALKSIYGITFKAFKPLDVGGPVTVSSLKNGQVDAADLFSTDPAIKANNFVALTDSRNQFAAQNIVPLATKAKITQTIADAANAVSAKLDTDTLAGLVAKVQNDKQDPEAVAKAWLSQNGLG
jgi:osmoprotectant transport system substrate-binding protein